MAGRVAAPVVRNMITPWAAKVDPAALWQEYPRPPLQRGNWICLNGLWEWGVADSERGVEEGTKRGIAETTGQISQQIFQEVERRKMTRKNVFKNVIIVIISVCFVSCERCEKLYNEDLAINSFVGFNPNSKYKVISVDIYEGEDNAFLGECSLIERKKKLYRISGENARLFQDAFRSRGNDVKRVWKSESGKKYQVVIHYPGDDIDTMVVFDAPDGRQASDARVMMGACWSTMVNIEGFAKRYDIPKISNENR